MVAVHSGTSSNQGVRRQRVRRLLANMLTSLMVNAAIILAAPDSNGREPAPIVLQQQRELLYGCWAAGELVDVEKPMVAVVGLENQSGSNWFSPN